MKTLFAALWKNLKLKIIQIPSNLNLVKHFKKFLSNKLVNSKIQGENTHQLVILQIFALIFGAFLLPKKFSKVRIPSNFEPL